MVYNNNKSGEQANKRFPFPKQGQTLGKVDQRLGGSRMRVKCFDGNERICRIPGSKRKMLWIREGDIVLVIPWDDQSDYKGDVVFKYNRNQISTLQIKGFLNNADEFMNDEF